MTAHEVVHEVGVVLFDRFELLDVFGPLEFLGQRRDRFSLTLVGPEAGPVTSAQGVTVLADCGWFDASVPDVVLVPGGQGTRSLVNNAAFLTWLAEWAGDARVVTSVCTGAGLLGAAGLLDGYRATSNKFAFDWVVAQGPSVTWVPEARWVHDRDRWTSSGIAAGMDMTLALIADMCGVDVAERVATHSEYDWHSDPTWDPFAAHYGLVPPDK